LHANNSILFDYIYVRSKDKSLVVYWFIGGCTCTSNENCEEEYSGRTERENREGE
jgi:hypothetical protein